jgi:hypothetical protein
MLGIVLKLYDPKVAIIPKEEFALARPRHLFDDLNGTEPARI